MGREEEESTIRPGLGAHEGDFWRMVMHAPSTGNRL
jgi:hypothetical protein